jgi:hypothetical protein
LNAPNALLCLANANSAAAFEIPVGTSCVYQIRNGYEKKLALLEYVNVCIHVDLDVFRMHASMCE